jgi:hypothetical protein
MYTSSNASCTGTTTSSFIQHAVTLGIYCNLPSNPRYVFVDYYLECDDDSYSFDTIFDTYGVDGGRYICSTSATFPSGSSSTQVIPNVAIVTDNTWLTDPIQECFTISRASPPSSSSVTTFVPVLAPITNTPIPMALVPVSDTPVTSAPLQMNIDQPGLSPVAVVLLPVVPSPVVPRNNEAPMISRTAVSPVATLQTASATSRSSFGPLAGGIVGGLAVVCVFLIGLLAFGYIVYQKKNSSTATAIAGAGGGGTKPNDDMNAHDVTSSAPSHYYNEERHDIPREIVSYSQNSHGSNTGSNFEGTSSIFEGGCHEPPGRHILEA